MTDEQKQMRDAVVKLVFALGINDGRIPVSEESFVRFVRAKRIGARLRVKYAEERLRVCSDLNAVFSSFLSGRSAESIADKHMVSVDSVRDVLGIGLSAIEGKMFVWKSWLEENSRLVDLINLVIPDDGCDDTVGSND